MKLTKNFTLEEFLCKCPRCKGKLPSKKIIANITELALEIQKLRDTVNTPITIISGVRCPAHNKEVGGVSNSVHMTGSAADIIIKGYTASKMFEVASGIKSSQAKSGLKPMKQFRGVGYYPTQGFVHVDMGRNKPRPNTWEL